MRTQRVGNDPGPTVKESKHGKRDWPRGTEVRPPQTFKTEGEQGQTSVH